MFKNNTENSSNKTSFVFGIASFLVLIIGLFLAVLFIWSEGFSGIGICNENTASIKIFIACGITLIPAIIGFIISIKTFRNIEYKENKTKTLTNIGLILSLISIIESLSISILTIIVGACPIATCLF